MVGSGLHGMIFVVQDSKTLHMENGFGNGGILVIVGDRYSETPSNRFQIVCSQN